MERRSEIYDYREHANSNSAPVTAWNSNEALNIALPNDSNSNPNPSPNPNPAINSGIGSSSGGGGGGGSGGGGGRATNPCVIREQDQYMPIANVIRIMRRILPPHAKISDDAKETIQECVSEYISFITAEANERCQHEQRKTVTAEDVLWAMSKLGFDDYVEPLAVYLNRYRQAEAERTNLGGPGPFLRRGGSTSGGFVVGGGVGGGTNAMGMNMMDYGGGIVAPPPPPNLNLNIGGVGPYGPGFNMGPYPGPGMFDPTGGYFRDGSGGVGFGGGSTPQNLFGGYDPFAQFK